MSDVEKMIKELEEAHRIIKGLADNGIYILYREAKTIYDAISTIKELSDKNKWHKLSDNDFPQENGRYFVSYKNENYKDEPLWYSNDGNIFYNSAGRVVDCRLISAWYDRPEPYKGE